MLNLTVFNDLLQADKRIAPNKQILKRKAEKKQAKSAALTSRGARYEILDSLLLFDDKPIRTYEDLCKFLKSLITLNVII